MATLCVITDPSGFERIGIINDDNTITFMKQCFEPQIPDSISISTTTTTTTTTTEDQSADDEQQPLQLSRSHSTPSHHHQNNTLPQHHHGPTNSNSNGGNGCSSSPNKNTSPGGAGGDGASSLPLAPRPPPLPPTYSRGRNASFLSGASNCLARQTKSHRKSLLGIPKEEKDSADKNTTEDHSYIGSIHCEDDSDEAIAPTQKGSFEPQSPADTITTTCLSRVSSSDCTISSHTHELEATFSELDASLFLLDSSVDSSAQLFNSETSIDETSHQDASGKLSSKDLPEQAAEQYKEDPFDKAFELIAAKGLKRGIDYLISHGLLTSYPKHISAFLRFHQSAIDPGVLGEYLGEGGIADGEFGDFTQDLIRFNYTRATSFVGMDVEEALRHFLTSCGFRLPGEAQKIDRIISTFSECYWKDNAGDMQICPFQNQDTVFLVSFAIIMLNTDLHRSHSGKGKAPKRMTKQEFIKNLRGADADIDKSRYYVYSIYNSIKCTPIAISHCSDPEKRNLSQTKVPKGFLSKTKLSLHSFRSSVSKV